MEFRILGPLEVVADGRAVDISGSKARVLLAALLVAPNRSASRDALVDALWEDEPPATAAKALQVHVSQLRKAIGPARIETTPRGYRLRLDAEELDMLRFERLVESGQPRIALELWRGEPLQEFERARFAQPEIARLLGLRLAALEAALTDDLAAGRHANALAELERLLAAHPTRERLRELHLLALYRAGRQADALAEYAAVRAALVEELGIEPGRPLRELQQAILRQDPALELASEPGDSSVFVGRADELAELQARLDDMLAGRGHLIVVEGEAGIGKTRLVEELIRGARARRVEVRTGRCWEATAAPAYWPWLEALEQLDLGGLVLPGRTAADPEAARFDLFEGVVAFLRDTSRRHPILLFLDDMHAADEPSLLLLRFVARAVTAMRVLVVVATRDARALADLAGERSAMLLQLRGLSRDDVEAYLGSAAEPPLVATLYERTEGNALFLAETVRLLEAEGRVAIPTTVRAAIARRYERLSGECLRNLEIAAVLGREFDLATVARVAASPDEQVAMHLDEASAARIVGEVTAVRGRFRFAHILFRDALYEDIPVGKRMAIHRRAADVLGDLHRLDPGRLAEVAQHALAAADLERARTTASAAARHAVDILAYEEAARLYGVAIAAAAGLADAGATVRCELLLALGDAQSRAGATESAKHSFEEAAALARRTGLRSQLAHAATGYGGRVLWARAGRDRKLVPLLEEAVDAAVGDPRLQSRLLARLSGALRDEHDRARRDAVSSEAVALARASGDPTALAYALIGRAHAITGPDTMHDVLSIADELSGLSLDLECEVAGRMLRIMALLVAGQAGAATAELALVDGLVRELRQPVQRWEIDGVRAMLALAEGRFDEADPLIENTAAAGRRVVPEAAGAVERMQQATLRDFRGGLEASEPEIAALAAEQPARPVFACALAYVRARVGRTSEAARAVERLARDGAAAVPFDQEWLAALSFLADAAALVEDSAAAESLYEAIRPWGPLCAVDQGEVVRGSVARSLGVLATVLRRWDDADAHFAEAVEANARMGFRSWVARTNEDQAASRRRRNGVGAVRRRV